MESGSGRRQTPVVSPDGFYQWDGTRWAPTTWVATPWIPSPPRYVSPRLRADLAVAFLLILVGTNCFDLINSTFDLALITGHAGDSFPGTQLLWSQDRNLLAAASWLLVGFPGSVVAVSLWIYGAYRNLGPMGERPSMSPGMAVAWFYIPIANLWKPLQVVDEIWTKTMRTRAPRLLAAWWAFWLVGSAAGIIQMQASLRETSDPSSRIGPLWLSFPSDVLYIVAGLLLVRIILTVTRTADQRQTGDAAPGVVRAAP